MNRFLSKIIKTDNFFYNLNQIIFCFSAIYTDSFYHFQKPIL